MWYENKLTNRLGIKYPIIQAGMAGGVTTPELVAAVSSAGALGTLGAGYMSAEQMNEEVRKIKELTSHPFGVNVFVPEKPNVSKAEIETANGYLTSFRDELGLEVPFVSEQFSSPFEKQIEVILKERVPVCSFTFGVPSKEVIEELKKRGVVVIGTATTVEEAVVNEESGMDMVVAQGSEAGGHRGTFSGSFEHAMVGTMALIPQVVDHVKIPVIAAGGIMDGRGVLASLVLGAIAAQMGTAFVTSLESGAKHQHKEAILASNEDRPVVTSAFSGKPARGIENRFITLMKEHEANLPDYPIQNKLTKDIRKEAANQNKPEYMSLWSGQNPRLSKKRIRK